MCVPDERLVSPLNTHCWGITRWWWKWMKPPTTRMFFFPPSWGCVIVNYKPLNSAVMLLVANRPYPILWLEVALVSCSASWWISQMLFSKLYKCTLKWDKKTAFLEFSHIYYNHRQQWRLHRTVTLVYFNKTQRTHMQSYDHTFAGS